MKKTIFIILFGILFLASCSNQKKSKETNSEVTTDQIHEADDSISEEVEGAIDDSGEAIQDSTEEADPE